MSWQPYPSRTIHASVDPVSGIVRPSPQEVSGGGARDEADRAEASFAERKPHWGDEGWWQAQIDAAIASPDPVICNLRITLTHQELSLALHLLTGVESGANFHTWAVWGSKQAGQTIREQDLPALPRAGWGLGTLLGASGAAAVANGSLRRRVGVSVAVGTAGGMTLNRAASGVLGRAKRCIYGGNLTVLTDIGRETARFVGAFSDPDKRQPDRLEAFLSRLRPGAAADGGQDLLRGAYRHYYDASREADQDRRDELMLCANLLAILHEHERLEPYIDDSVPRPIRRFVTKHLLGFTVGAEAMKVGLDVPTRGPTPFPETLSTIENHELESLLTGPQGWDRTPNSVAGSGAQDWTKLSDRMNFIVDLFRSRTDPNLFAAPFSSRQREMIIAGCVPGGPL
jgi:hypothetical protein